MSKFSGKCDLYDHIMMGKLYPSPEYPGVQVSDEMECFELFKEATGGVIYQNIKVEVTEYNQKLVSELSGAFRFSVEEVTEPSSKCKQKYRYKYFDKECTLKEINKHGIYIFSPIYFNTLLDIIPYYPYIITSAITYNGKQRIVISNNSYADTQAKEHFKYGHLPIIDYKAVLQQHYVEVVNRYFNPEGRKVTKTFIITPDLDLCKFNLGEAIDYNWEVEVMRDKHLWINSAPKIIDADKGIIDISSVWPYDKLESITLTYVRKRENKLYLS